MSSERKVYRLDELCEFINGFAFKSSDYVEESDGTWEVLRMGYINRGGGFKEDATPVFVPRAYGKDLGKYLIRTDDIVIAMTDMKNNVAILGNTARIKDANRFVLNQRVGCIRVKPMGLVDPSYLYYYSNWQPHVDYLRARANSGVQVNLSTPAIREAEIELPPLAEQVSIGSLLSALDDRITLLRETNATLEAIAQALFKSWFVDFDPVRAKMEGRTPEGMDEATAALFPDGFETSELGEVPRGWRVGKLGDVAALKGGKQLSKEAFSNSAPNPVFGGAGVMGHTAQRNATDFVITVGRVGAYCGQFFWHIGNAWVNNNASHVVPSRKISSEWLLLWLKSVNMDVIKKGAAQPFVSNGDIAKLSMIHPPIELIDAFGALVAPMFARSQLLVQQSVELASVRDTLLPRLISGQLRLSEAQAATEAALGGTLSV